MIDEQLSLRGEAMHIGAYVRHAYLGYIDRIVRPSQSGHPGVGVTERWGNVVLYGSSL